MIRPSRWASALRERFPGVSRFVGWLRPGRIRRRLGLIGKGREEVFTYIYRNRFWDASESVSGAGSTLSATEPLRRRLPQVLESLGVRSLLDAPCGDFHWMKSLDLDLDSYIGGDIVEPLVEDLAGRYGSETRRFVHLDIVQQPLPEADAFFCRDCFLHLSLAEVSMALDNARRSSCRYLLASSYPACDENAEIRTGLSRPLNLCLPPFSLPEPMLTIDDPGPHVERKVIGVWDLDGLR